MADRHLCGGFVLIIDEGRPGPWLVAPFLKQKVLNSFKLGEGLAESTKQRCFDPVFARDCGSGRLAAQVPALTLTSNETWSVEPNKLFPVPCCVLLGSFITGTELKGQ